MTCHPSYSLQQWHIWESLTIKGSSNPLPASRPDMLTLLIKCGDMAAPLIFLSLIILKKLGWGLSVWQQYINTRISQNPRRKNFGLKQGRCSCTEAIGYAWGTTGPVQRKRDVLQHSSKSWRACNDMLIWKRRVKTSDDRLALQHPIPAPHTISVLLPKMYLIEILTKKNLSAEFLKYSVR